MRQLTITASTPSCRAQLAAGAARRPLQSFHPAVERWFTTTLGAPTAAQAAGLGRDPRRPPHADRGADRLGQDARRVPDRARRTVSRRLDAPAAGRDARDLRVAAQGAQHRHPQEPGRAARGHSPRSPPRWDCAAPAITSAVRTGDTPASARAAMVRTPPHILVTTPESLYLLLTSERSRERLRHVRTVIVDEIHAVIGTRRGAHLALSLERLAALTERPPLRIGLSATQRPRRAVARFLRRRRDASTTMSLDCARDRRRASARHRSRRSSCRARRSKR